MLNYYFVSYFFRDKDTPQWKPARIEFGLDEQVIDSIGMVEAIEKHLMDEVNKNAAAVRVIYFKLLRSTSPNQPEQKRLLGEVPPKESSAYDQLPYDSEP